MKISVIGAGNVGATIAQRISSFELAREVVIIDVVDGVAQGKALDIYQAAPLVQSDCRVSGSSSYEATTGSDIAVITAGIPRRSGMTRDDILVKNAEIVDNTTRRVIQRSPNCIIIVVSSPIDEMTYVAWRASKLNRRRVIGMSGVLDAARLRTFIAMELGAAVEDVEAMVLGGHGESMIPLIRHATVAGLPLSQLLAADRIEEIVGRTRNAANEIIGHLRTGSAFYAPSAAVTAMVRAIVRDKPHLMPCALALDGEYGLRDVVMGVPARLGRNGVDQIIEIELLEEEREALQRSAHAVRENLAKLSFPDRQVP